MNFNSLDKTNERKKNAYILGVVIAIIIAFVFSGLLQLTFKFIVWLIKLIITNWKKVAIALIVILFLKRFVRRKNRVQNMRIVE